LNAHYQKIIAHSFWAGLNQSYPKNNRLANLSGKALKAKTDIFLFILPITDSPQPALPKL
jgi:hypothetical protein